MITFFFGFVVGIVFCVVVSVLAAFACDIQHTRE